MYRIDCEKDNGERTYMIELDDHTIQQMSGASLISVLQAGLKACGYINDQHVKSLNMQPSAC